MQRLSLLHRQRGLDIRYLQAEPGCWAFMASENPYASGLVGETYIETQMQVITP